MNKSLLLLGLSLASPAVLAMSEEPIHIGQLLVDQLELRDSDEGQILSWDLSAWYGGDLNKLCFASEGERLMDPEHDDQDAGTESAETRLAWSQAFAPFWDWQLGARRDWQPDDPNRDWASIGIRGLAPYQFEMDADLFIGEHGLSNLRVKSEYELLFTQKLILVPSVEANLYGKADKELGIGDGLTDIEAGLRLRYEIRRELAPYIGVHWQKQYGDTADYTRAEGGQVEETMLVAGIRFWY